GASSVRRRATSLSGPAIPASSQARKLLVGTTHAGGTGRPQRSRSSSDAALPPTSAPLLPASRPRRTTATGGTSPVGRLLTSFPDRSVIAVAIPVTPLLSIHCY